MGIYDRDYTHEGYEGGGGGPRMRLTMPSLTPVVKWLLISNIAVFIVSFLVPRIGLIIDLWFSVYPETVAMRLQLWRLISYQFLHADIFHIFFNMLVLYFFGPMIERLWGSRKFLVFYLICGAAGGVVYTVLVAMKILSAMPMVGASGAIYGMLAAGAILFPGLRVYVMGIFPMTLRTLAIIIAVISLLKFMGGQNAGGEAAHLAGMAAGVAYVLWRPQMQARMLEHKKGAWARKIQNERNLHAEVDRILEKVHASGIHSLTRKEKSILKEATQREQRDNR